MSDKVSVCIDSNDGSFFSDGSVFSDSSEAVSPVITEVAMSPVIHWRY